MGLMSRLSGILHMKASKALDKAEDPRETLDYSYEKQLEMLRKVKGGVAEVATSRKRIELQAEQLQQRANKLQTQAQTALQQNREDLAREALSRREAVGVELAALKAQHDQLSKEEAKLVTASQRLQTKVDTFRTRKETIKATYTAAEAQARIGEAFTGISEEMGDVGLAIQRAEDKTAQLQARSGAIDELIASGALDDATAQPGDDIDAELNKLSASSNIDLELERMKAQLGTGSAPKALPGNEGDSK